MSEHGARYSGWLVLWQGGDLGYGFIRPDNATQPDIFVNQFAFNSARITPREGMLLSYTVGSDRGGRPRADHLRLGTIEEAEEIPDDHLESMADIGFMKG